MLSPASEVRVREFQGWNSPGSTPRSGTAVAPEELAAELAVYANDLLERGLKEERFRIDRKKLEDMLQIQSNNGSIENAEMFFQKVMKDTDTLISWPSKLKIGAKSKKDPHVKIVGLPDDVQSAKTMILEVLDTKKNRVTLKMDVPHTDHSYIIGKGGFKIQQVMEETGCHIHFPDSNRNSSLEKSNQVSIAGQAAGVELARAKIRELLPLVFMFELPSGECVKPGEESSPAVQHIQQTYSFNVTFRSVGPAPLARTLVVVRGCHKLLARLRQGLSLLMEYLIGSKTIPLMGFMKTEIAVHHHQFVMGACGANTQAIMSKTGATVIFPDPAAFGPDSPTQAGPVVAGHSILRSKSTVIIQGSFDSVCLAWQELLQCLPLVLMFDLKEGQELDSVMVNNFMESFNINIMVRPKIKENTKSVLIRGAEKDCRVLFQVRRSILGLEEDSSSGQSTPCSFGTRLSSGQSTPCSFGTRSSSGQSSPCGFSTRTSTFLPASDDAHHKHTQNMSAAESLSLLTNILQQNPQIVGLLNNLTSVLPQTPPSLPNPLARTGAPSMQQQHHYADKRDIENWINRQQYAMPAASNIPSYLQKEQADDGDSGIFIPTEKFMPSRNRFQHGLEAMSDLSGSKPESSASSTSSNDNTPDYRATNSFLRKISTDQGQALGAEVHQLLGEYGNKKLSAGRAMNQAIGDGARTPTQLWSGYGFSKSMPDFAARAAKRAAQNTGSISEYLSDVDCSKVNGMGAEATKAWTADLLDKCDSPFEQAASPFSFSNFWETVPQQPAINYGAIKSVEQLLNLLDLDKYIELFTHNEIDLTTLLTVSDADLQGIGLSYGARRKLISAIAAIRDYKLEECTLKSFRAAPGAERRTFLGSRYPSSCSTPSPDPARA